MEMEIPIQFSQQFSKFLTVKSIKFSWRKKYVIIPSEDEPSVERGLILRMELVNGWNITKLANTIEIFKQINKEMLSCQ